MAGEGSNGGKSLSRSGCRRSSSGTPTTRYFKRVRASRALPLPLITRIRAPPRASASAFGSMIRPQIGGNMRRIIVILAACFVATIAFASPAVAASPHFKKGGEPVCSFSGTTSIPVTCTATLSGLGNQDVKVHLSVSGLRSISVKMGAVISYLGRTGCWPGRQPQIRQSPRARSRMET